jgi:hypothetical protein
MSEDVPRRPRTSSKTSQMSLRRPGKTCMVVDVLTWLSTALRIACVANPPWNQGILPRLLPHQCACSDSSRRAARRASWGSAPSAYSVVLLVGRHGGRLDEDRGAGRAGEVGRTSGALARERCTARLSRGEIGSAASRSGIDTLSAARGTHIAHGRAIRASFSARVNLGRFAGRSVMNPVAVAARVGPPRTDARPPFVRDRWRRAAPAVSPSMRRYGPAEPHADDWQVRNLAGSRNGECASDFERLRKAIAAEGDRYERR